jgi:hypothetical protein
VALSDDQKAMLRLLAQREQGYDDLASLMGLSVDEVRAKVKEALEEIDKGEAAVPPPPPPEPPKAETPPPPKAPQPEKPTSAPKAATSPPKPAVRKPWPKPSLPADRRLRIGAVAAGALAVVLVILLVAGVIGGGDGSDSSGSPAAGDANGSATTTASSDQTTQAVLSPVDGGDASGQALFGRIRNTAVLQVEAEGLDPSPRGQLYTVWLYRSPRIALRVGAVKVTDSGGIGAQFPLPTEVLGYVAGGGFDQIDISLTSSAAYRAEVVTARREQRLPAYTGASVLRGEITGRLVEAGARSNSG